jgi:CHASE1-domain containing sensor protein
MNSQEQSAAYSAFVPLLLVIVLLLGMLGAQLNERVQQRELLQQLISNQSEPLAETRRVREQFQSLVSGTSRLAAAGNVEALRIQAELERVGIRFDANEEG